jgi:hypothetical protein
MSKPSIDRPFWNAKVIAEFKEGETYDVGDILAELQDLLNQDDYNHHDPMRSECKVTRSFQIVVREGK